MNKSTDEYMNKQLKLEQDIALAKKSAMDAKKSVSEAEELASTALTAAKLNKIKLETNAMILDVENTSRKLRVVIYLSYFDREFNFILLPRFMPHNIVNHVLRKKEISIVIRKK